MRNQTNDSSPEPKRRLRRARLAILLIAALPVLARPATATSQLPPDGGLLRFYLESVAVEGVRHASPEVIVSESLLEAGVAYTEAELRSAVYRVNRLPFVLDATFSLGRGSERGRYTLLITVEEVRGLFFGSDLVYAARGDALSRASPLTDELTDSLSAGMRVFAGQGVFFAAVGDHENLQIGYERYRLADRPVLLRLAYARQGCCSSTLQQLGLDPAAGVWTAAEGSDRLELTLGVPLAGNHSLRFDASLLETGSAVRQPLGSGEGASFSSLDVHDVEQREIELAWVFDSTDDPVFPSRGDALTAAVGVRWLEGDLADTVGSGVFGSASEVSSRQMSSRQVGLSAFGARHWPLSARQTVSLSLKLLASRSEVENIPLAPLRGDVSRADLPLESAPGGVAGASIAGGLTEVPLWSGDVDTFEAGFGARYSLGLWGPGKIRRLGALRWETVAELIYADSSPVLSPTAHPLWGVSLSTGIALRNTWGIFRIGFTYIDFDGTL